MQCPSCKQTCAGVLTASEFGFVCINRGGAGNNGKLPTPACALQGWHVNAKGQPEAYRVYGPRTGLSKPFPPDSVYCYVCHSMSKACLSCVGGW